MAGQEKIDMDFTDCWQIDGELVVSLNLGATHITTACLKIVNDDRIPIPLIRIEGSEAYKDYMKSVLQYEPEPRYVVWDACASDRLGPGPEYFTKHDGSSTSNGLITVDGVDVQPLTHYDNDSIHKMFKQTLDHVISALRVAYGIESKLGVIICPRNLSATTKRLIDPDWHSVSHCELLNAIPAQTTNVASAAIMMDGTSGTSRGFGMLSREEEDEFFDWYVITVAVFPSTVQILVDVGPMLNHQTDTYECVPEIDIDENGDWRCLADFQCAFANAMENSVGRSEFDHIARVVVTGDIQPSAAAQLSTAIESVAPYLQGKIQGVDNPAFITAMGAACVCYEWNHAKPLGPQLQPSV